MLIKTTHPVQAPAQSRCCLVAKSLRLFATPWTVGHQAPLSMGFPRQKYCSGLPFPSPGDLLDPGIEPESPALAAGFFTLAPWEAHFRVLREAFFTFRPKGLTRLIISFSYGWIHLLGG